MPNVMSISRFLNFSLLFLCIFYIGGREGENPHENPGFFTAAQKIAREAALSTAIM